MTSVHRVAVTLRQASSGSVPLADMSIGHVGSCPSTRRFQDRFLPVDFQHWGGREDFARRQSHTRSFHVIFAVALIFARHSKMHELIFSFSLGHEIHHPQIKACCYFDENTPQRNSFSIHSVTSTLTLHYEEIKISKSSVPNKSEPIFFLNFYFSSFSSS